MATLAEPPRSLKAAAWCAAFRACRIAGWLALLLPLGCGRGQEDPPGPLTLPIEVLADTGRSSQPWPAPEGGEVAAWIARVSAAPSPAAPARPGEIEAPLPPAEPGIPPPEPAPPRLEIDPDLKPPIPRVAAPLHVPRSAHGRASVELDVQVDERGDVTEAQWAAGSTDSALVRAALDCARAMRFYPALRGGAPVAVWCRQRFDFGR